MDLASGGDGYESEDGSGGGDLPHCFELVVGEGVVAPVGVVVPGVSAEG